MAPFVALDSVLYWGAYDLTSAANEIAVEREADEVDATNFGSGGAREFKAGIEKTSLKAATFFDGSTTEAALQSNWGTVDQVVSTSPTATANQRGATLMKGIASKIERSFKVGDMAMLNISGASNATPGQVSGFLILPKSTSTSTTNGTAYQNGAVASTESVYAALHVFSVSGTSSPTLTVKLQSDDNSGMSSATDRVSFTAATAAGAEFKSTAGAITDDYWRVAWTISGTNPSFSFAVLMGIA